MNTQSTDSDYRAACSHKHRILVVEDNRDAAELFRRVLSHLGNECRVAHNGAAALEVGREFLPDIAFVDITLPDVSGYELAAPCAREQPIIASSLPR